MRLKSCLSLSIKTKTSRSFLEMNRDFLVTGGARGIGKEICKHILSGGGRVFFTDLSTERGERTRAELVALYGQARLDFTQQDVADCDQWSQVWLRAEQFFGGEVEALCNNAGIYETYQSTNTNIINVNLLGVVYGTNLAMEKMSGERGGRGGLIVQISSMAGLVTTSASPLYCASKAGVVAYLRSHRTRASAGVRMVAVCPCLTDTPLIRAVLGRDDTEPLTSQYGMRSLTVREVAQAFQRAVLSGAPGSALLLHPEVSFYWPDSGLAMFNFYCLAARILLQLTGSSEPVEPQQIAFLLVSVLILLVYICHVLLGYVGW